MNDIQTFRNEAFGEIRTLTINDEPWFVGKDVAQILGYENPTKAIRDHVDEEDKKMGVQNVTPSITDAMGRKQYPTWINESGLYSLILSSKLPDAKKFKRWVTSEVLPAIRKTGGYGQTDSYLIADPIKRAERWIEEQKEKQRLYLETKVQSQQIAELKPKATYCDEILRTQNAVPITKIAKDYGMSGKALNAYLKAQGVQYKLSKTWLLTAKYQGFGYTETETVAYGDQKQWGSIQMKWTQKGRMFLYGFLKERNILPLIERD